MSTAATFAHIIETLRDRGCAPRLRRGGESVRAKCPIHADRDPSFVVSLKSGKILMRCFGGCRQGELVRAFGLTFSDLFDGLVAVPRTQRSIIATYAYAPNVEKVRYAPKAFSWRHQVDGDWRSGFPDGFTPSLYRIDDLAGCEQVVLVEGERAVERLLSLGIAATCPPSGASSWPAHLTPALWRVGCRDVVILPDHDQAGRAHAERVAAACYAAPPPEGCRVRVVELPNLETGQDVVDFLVTHTAADLRDVIAQTPDWYPGATDARRRERRRQLTRERVRRHRRHRADRRHVDDRDGNGQSAAWQTDSKPMATVPVPQRERAPEPVTQIACNAPNVSGVTQISCNAPNVSHVTRNAVTHPERSSMYVTGVFRDLDLTVDSAHVIADVDDRDTRDLHPTGCHCDALGPYAPCGWCDGPDREVAHVH